jgi:hypothetical protein
MGGTRACHRGARVDRDLAIEMFARDRLEIFWQFDGGVQHQDIDLRPGGDGAARRCLASSCTKSWPNEAAVPPIIWIS